MAGTSGDLYVIHQDVQKINATMTNASTTLNTTIQNLMNQVKQLIEAGWDGLGASAYSGYMDRYDADQKKMNQALSVMSDEVRSADVDYMARDEGVQSAFSGGH